jgi:hypothetical protein
MAALPRSWLQIVDLTTGVRRSLETVCIAKHLLIHSQQTPGRTFGNGSGTHGCFGPMGLVALADVDTVATRTACTGSASFLDAFVIVPGLHRQQHAMDLSKGEYPACAAMTTGYVFRVENQATVLYLQKVGRTGHLTTLEVRYT